jgi:hypothetical protein
MMNSSDNKSSSLNRRQFMYCGALLTAAGVAFPFNPAMAAPAAQPDFKFLPDGGTGPYPIPWLDRNGSHNQSPGPGMEPSSIYHFKGHVARCNNFTGIGTDNKGNRLAFGSPSTDFSFMAGEYYSARNPQQGIFSHI